MNGETDRVIPGNAAVVDKSMPFTQLSNFGNNFLQRFEVVSCKSPVLEGLTFVDTPGKSVSFFLSITGFACGGQLKQTSRHVCGVSGGKKRNKTKLQQIDTDTQYYCKKNM
jgi:hypothetical protein